MLFNGLKEVALGADISKIDLAKRFEVHSSVKAKFEKRWSIEIIDTGDSCSLKVSRYGLVWFITRVSTAVVDHRPRRYTGWRLRYVPRVRGSS
jgi:hypothetical protein